MNADHPAVAVHERDFGTMVALRGTEIVRVPIGLGVAESKTVDPGLFEEAAVFFACALSTYRGLAELGLLAGVGLILNWLAMLTLFPALLARLPFSWWARPAHPTRTTGVLPIVSRMLEYRFVMSCPCGWSAGQSGLLHSG